MRDCNTRAGHGPARWWLQRAAQSATHDGKPVDSLRCYTVKQVAQRLNVSPDTVRSEIETGSLGSITVGQRAKRIPQEALEERLSRWREEAGVEQG